MSSYEKFGGSVPGVGGQAPQANSVPPSYEAQQYPAMFQQSQNYPGAGQGPAVVAAVNSPFPPLNDPFEAQVGEDEIFKLDKHVQVDFNSVFPEPNAVRTWQPIKTVYRVIFEYTQFGFYQMISLFVGLLMSLTCGMIYAVANVALIWFIQPAAKLMFIFMRIGGAIYRVSVRLFIDPCFEAIGLSLASMKGTFSANLSGIPGGTEQVRHV